eukprot:1432582-Heterocapsa_arctica.AAC.1
METHRAYHCSPHKQIFLDAQKNPAKAWDSLRDIIQLALVIPKKDTLLCAGDVRPLTLPDTLVRIISAVTLMVLSNG